MHLLTNKQTQKEQMDVYNNINKLEISKTNWRGKCISKKYQRLEQINVIKCVRINLPFFI